MNDILLMQMQKHVEDALKDIEANGFPNKTAQPWQLPFHIQYWPKWVVSLSPIKTVGFSLQPNECDALIDAFGEGGCDKVLKELAEKIDAQGMDKFFVRLGSRSPKDSYGIMDGLMQRTGRIAVSVLAQSERVYVDLQSYKTAGEQPWLFLREWKEDIQELNEFRCFVVDGKLAGISQYQYHTDKDAIIPIAQCRKLITEFWHDISKRWLRDIGDGVFDVWVSDGRVNLLEINPPSVSDPCLFRDGLKPEIRYVNAKLSLSV